jgi:hypothetical protein
MLSVGHLLQDGYLARVDFSFGDSIGLAREGSGMHGVSGEKREKEHMAIFPFNAE